MIGKFAEPALGMVLVVAAMFSCGAEARPALNLEQEALIGRCIREAASGREWLERTLWGLRDQEAGWVGAEIANTNGTYDLGPMQINSWWLPKLSDMTGRDPAAVRAWLVHDACFNVRAARWIFLSVLGSTQDYWKAVGAYHSPTPPRQRAYAIAVARKLNARFGRTCAESDQIDVGCVEVDVWKQKRRLRERPSRDRHSCQVNCSAQACTVDQSHSALGECDQAQPAVKRADALHRRRS